MRLFAVSSTPSFTFFFLPCFIVQIKCLNTKFPILEVLIQIDVTNGYEGMISVTLGVAWNS